MCEAQHLVDLGPTATETALLGFMFLLHYLRLAPVLVPRMSAAPLPSGSGRTDRAAG